MFFPPRPPAHKRMATALFPEKFHFIGSMNSCYRQIGNAVPVKFAKLLGEELIRLEHNGV